MNGGSYVGVENVPHEEVPDRCWSTHQNSMEQIEDSPGQVLLETSSEDLLVWYGTRRVGGVGELDRMWRVGEGGMAE